MTTKVKKGKTGRLETADGTKYVVQHSKHQVTVQRLLLDDALKQNNFEGWSEARRKAFANRETNPNAYYYRFNDPGQQQAKGAWSDEEKTLFMKRKEECGVDGQWGIFAQAIPGRVGYQCSNFYRLLVASGEVTDPNYFVGEDGKVHFLKKKGLDHKKRPRSRNGTMVWRPKSFLEVSTKFVASSSACFSA